jgi:hypothetical protein
LFHIFKHFCWLKKGNTLAKLKSKNTETETLKIPNVQNNYELS